jgi:hypothetical protein
MTDAEAKVDPGSGLDIHSGAVELRQAVIGRLKRAGSPRPV